MMRCVPLVCGSTSAPSTTVSPALSVHVKPGDGTGPPSPRWTVVLDAVKAIGPAGGGNTVISCVAL